LKFSKIKFILLSFFLSGNVLAQEKPTIVIGIVVDQMTNDYLYRYNAHFNEGGFNRLISDGYYFPNTVFNYSGTSTGPGHASIYTGTTPSMHGIAGNSWFDGNKIIYCVEDNKEKWLPDSNIPGRNKVQKRSPSNLIGSTITDMLKLSSYGNSKVIGISLKDRGAVLPIGHSGDVALWWDNISEEWTTGSYQSRIYTYEQDLTGSYSIPSFSGKGSKVIFLVKFKLTRSIKLSLKIGHLVYDDRESIGSGLDEISGDTKTEVKWQCVMKF